MIMLRSHETGLWFFLDLFDFALLTVMKKYFAILVEQFASKFVYSDVAPDTTDYNLFSSQTEEVSIWSYGHDLVEEVLMAMSLWGHQAACLCLLAWLKGTPEKLHTDHCGAIW
jgi:hypothetical protein